MMRTLELQRQFLRIQVLPDMSQTLLQLSDELLAHLQYEEEEISDTLRTLSRWPMW